MCKFHFVFNTVRSLSLDFESEVLPSGKDFQIKKKPLPYALVYPLEHYYGYTWASLYVVCSSLCTCLLYLYLFAFMDTPWELSMTLVIPSFKSSIICIYYLIEINTRGKVHIKGKTQRLEWCKYPLNIKRIQGDSIFNQFSASHSSSLFFEVINPLTPKISLLILLTVCHTIL